MAILTTKYTVVMFREFAVYQKDVFAAVASSCP